LPEIKICGFVVTGNHVRALFASVPKTAKEAGVYYDLSEGQSDGILRLQKINLDEQEAEVVNSGVPMRLTMRENGFKVAPPSLATVPGPVKPVVSPALPLPPGLAVPHG